MTASSQLTTYEGICDAIVGDLRRAGAIPPAGRPTPWDSFLRLSRTVHDGFYVPGTTLTPMMRRLLFALATATTKRHLVGVGTFVGYAFAWLLRDRDDADSGPHFEWATGVDVDAAAVEMARKNCRVLGHGERLSFVAAEGAGMLRELDRSVDLLYIDVDDPVEGKAAYSTVLEAALPLLEPNALVLAHDPIVPRFRAAFSRYEQVVEDSGCFTASWTLPVDDCGLLVSVREE